MLSPPLALVPGLPGKWADICWRVTGQQNIAEKPRVPNVSYVANMKPEADIDFTALRFEPCGCFCSKYTNIVVQSFIYETGGPGNCLAI